MRNVTIIVSLFILNISPISAQKYLRLNDESSLRFEQKNYEKTTLHSNIKPFVKDSLSEYNNAQDTIHKHLIINRLTSRNLLKNETSKTFATINPIIDIMPTFHIKDSKILHDYKLGISANMAIGKNLFINLNGFYGIASFGNMQSLFLDSTKIIPGYGKIISKKNLSLYDYYNINTYISYNVADFLNLQCGIGKNFWGEGYRSLFLSDNSTGYPFLKASVNIWKFKYIWLFGALKDPNSEDITKKLRNKLLFSHYLSWNATKWLNLNFFEAIVSNPVDSIGINYVNINYLNPVIFFRPAEFAGGSADNALLGLGAKLRIYKKYQIYGQFIIDEFVLSEIKANNKWWGNKFGVQAGIKIFNLGNIKNLFTRLEYNMVRPYTYSYSNSIMCYGSHYQALAHNEGANFGEFIFQIHYFKKRYSFDFTAIEIESGRDFDNVSYGQNIYKPYTLRKNDYGNNFKQGYLSKLTYLRFSASYLVNSKMNLAVQLIANYNKQQLYNESSSGFYVSFGIITFLYNNKLHN